VLCQEGNLAEWGLSILIANAVLHDMLIVHQLSKADRMKMVTGVCIIQGLAHGVCRCPHHEQSSCPARTSAEIRQLLRRICSTCRPSTARVAAAVQGLRTSPWVAAAAPRAAAASAKPCSRPSRQDCARGPPRSAARTAETAEPSSWPAQLPDR
jgi:hypothetical protein